MIRLAVVSDEISRDFAVAVKVGTEWGIRDFELRYLKSGRVPFVSREEVDTVLHFKEMYGARISALSPGLFQISLRDEAELKQQLEENIYETFRLADRLETKRVIIFGFKKYPREPETNYIQIIHILSRMASLAQKYGFTLLLENLADTWADTGENTAKILNDVNSGSLRANWDLANAYMSGEIPYPYGYLAIRRHLSAIHVKDVKENKSAKFEFAVVGDGEIDWDGQIRAIVSSQETDFLTIETHCQPIPENSRLNVMKMKNLIEKYQLDENYIVK
ncbi:MAG: sugar phosphate isomerase/epimerase [Calditrichaeota bacterium]|nr:sugar phosphate isomerase/epimerase [Calditrichota bacterium]